jgi:UTP--glucose-1-phosphate uridylyltransferase
MPAADMTDASAARRARIAALMRQAGLGERVIAQFDAAYTDLCHGADGLIPESAIEPVAGLVAHAELARHRAAGEALAGRVAQLKLNGGLGTSMGLDGPKSLLEARESLSFLEVALRQHNAYAAAHHAAPALALLNSFSTDADTRAALACSDAGRRAAPTLLLQTMAPKIRCDTLEPVEWPDDPTLAWCPPGHGEVFLVLAVSGWLDRLIGSGYRYLMLSNIDNLGATIDPAIVGYMADRQIPFLMEVARRTEQDRKGGHLARGRDGGLLLREVAQCPADDLATFQDIARHRYFNTNTIWVDLIAVRDVLARHGGVLRLPLIRNRKTVDPRRADSPAVYQLETAMGAAIAQFPGATAVVVDRERFVPVKVCADLLALRSDRYALDAAGHLVVHSAAPISITLDPRYYQRIDAFDQRFAGGAPSLIACRRLTVEGDVWFDTPVTCRGDVTIRNRGTTAAHLTDHHSWHDSVVELG